MELIKGFMKKYDQKLGIVVTKNLDQSFVRDNLLYVPLAIFLLFF
jgi:predicted AAA+ superfamily ATPase